MSLTSLMVCGRFAHFYEVDPLLVKSGLLVTLQHCGAVFD